MKKYILGIDLGITSVGWGIIDRDFNIIAQGVRLFEEAGSEKNQKRRNFRGTKRTLSRRKNRIQRMFKYLEEIGVIEPNFICLANPYEIRVKGIKDRLSNQELATALLHIAKRRGSNFEIVDTDKKESDLKATLKNNHLLASEKYVCEIQLDYFENNQKIRGELNLFKTEDYIREVKKILSNQTLSSSQQERIVSIIESRRLFSDGPGSINFPTKYGRFRPVDEKLENEIKKYLVKYHGSKYLKETFIVNYKDEEYQVFKSGVISNKNPLNLIDIMKGKCSLFPQEFRAPKLSFSAELYNLLNDLNNFSYGDEGLKLTIEQKTEIINIVRTKGKFSFSDLKKYVKLDKDEQISGLRIEKDKPELSKLKGYSKLLKVYNKLECKIDSDDVLDKIAEVLTSFTTFEERKEQLKTFLENVVLIDELSALSEFKGTHSFSFKALRFLIKELMETSLNQQQIIEQSKIRKQNEQDRFTLDLNVLNSVAKRVHNEAFKVYRELVKEFGEFDKVIIETTREKNSEEQKDNIKKIQKANQENKEEAIKIIEQSGYNNDRDLGAQLILKLRLYNEQNCKCAYSGLPIDLGILLRDPQYYQIDHIIPYSISFDDSMNNKVLSIGSINNRKDNKTPFGYFSSGNVDSKSLIKNYDQFKTIVESNSNYSKYKKSNLLFEKDITKYSVLEEFKNRNLTDTSYGIVLFMNNLKQYIKHNSQETKVFTIKGKQTHLFRKIAIKGWNKDNPNSDEKNPFIKDRNAYMHHAIDALIIAALSEQKLFKKRFNTIEDDKLKYDVNPVTGEVIERDPTEDSDLIKYFKRLSLIKSEDVRFSWKIDSKVNRELSDQTIYSVREIDGEKRVIKKHKNIYEMKKEQLKKIIDDPEKAGLLIYRNDIKTFEIIKKAYEQYQENDKPLGTFKENHGVIRKYSKTKLGAPVTSLKYVEDKLGMAIDISHKYNKSAESVVLLQLKTQRIDIYKNDKLYKFVTIRRHHLKYDAKINKYVINKDIFNYEQEKAKKKIDDSFVFQFSLTNNSVVFISESNKDGNASNLFRFIGVNNDKTNAIEFKKIDVVGDKRYMITIGKSIKNMIKYNVSPTGKMKKVIKEGLTLEF